jgi:RimJ/RimL family protein N-acetyltransferase
VIITDERVARYVGERCGTIIYPPFTCMGIERDGAIIGGAVFNCFTGHDVEMTVAGEARAFTRQFYRAVREYVFTQMGCLRVSITTEQTKVIELAKRLGAQTEGCKRNHFGTGRDGIVLGILKEDWKI